MGQALLSRYASSTMTAMSQKPKLRSMSCYEKSEPLSFVT